MKCPQCGHPNDKVLETRLQKEGEQIRRRRECLKCKYRFSTLESLALTFPVVIKKDGRREEYSPEKVFKGIQAACQKRPIGLRDVESIVERVTQWVSSRGDKEISTQDIGLKVMKELRILDDVAYVRFASVYRTFQDLQEFMSSLGSMELFETDKPSGQMSLTPQSVFSQHKGDHDLPLPTKPSCPRPQASSKTQPDDAV
jgi:transcriptional repressor NrdR